MTVRAKLATVLFVLVFLNVAVFVAKAEASRPWEPVAPQRICYMGHIGQPSGCRYLWMNP